MNDNLAAETQTADLENVGKAIATLEPDALEKWKTKRTAEAIRSELLELCKSADGFGIGSLHRMVEIARTGKALLQAVDPQFGGPPDKRLPHSGLAPGVLDLEATSPSVFFGGDDPIAPSSPFETFGGRVLRDLQPAISKLLGQRDTRSVEDLVLAYAAAKDADLLGIAATLKQKIQTELGTDETPLPDGKPEDDPTEKADS